MLIDRIVGKEIAATPAIKIQKKPIAEKPKTPPTKTPGPEIKRKPIRMKPSVKNRNEVNSSLGKKLREAADN